MAREAPWTAVVAEKDGRPGLTEREREVITLLAAGLQNNDIAERLFLSPETVKSHISNAMRKLAHARARRCDGPRGGADHLEDVVGA